MEIFWKNDDIKFLRIWLMYVSSKLNKIFVHPIKEILKMCKDIFEIKFGFLIIPMLLF